MSPKVAAGICPKVLRKMLAKTIPPGADGAPEPPACAAWSLDAKPIYKESGLRRQC